MDDSSGSPAGGDPAASPSPVGTRRRGLLLTAAVGVVLGAWAVAVATASLGARDDLTAARADLLEARGVLATGDVDGGAARLAAAETRLERASGRLARPDVVAASRVPVVGRNLLVARAVADGSLEVTRAGADALAALGALRQHEALEGAALPIDAIVALADPLARLSAAVDEAIEAAAAAPDAWLLAEVADARSTFVELLTPLSREARIAAQLTEQLPAFLGADGPRRYFLAAANPAELRGAGGFLGSYSLLTIDDGVLAFGRFRELSDLPELPADAVDPAGLVAERWAPFEPTRRWKNVNLTPDVPTAASTIEAMWAASTGEPLDGVIIVDPFALEILLEITGPVEGPGGASLAADEVVDYLTHDAYAEITDSQARKEILGGVATVVLERFLRRAGDAIEHVDELGALVGQRHLMLHAADPDVQSAFEAAGIAGALETDATDLLAVVANSASNAKLDWYLERTLRYDVTLGEDGSAVGELGVSFRNTAPSSGEVNYVIGPNVDGLEAGENRFHLSTYCATTCEMLAGRGGRTGRLVIGEELGHAVAGGWVELPSGASADLHYLWRNDAAWREEGGRLVYDLLVRSQTAIRRPDIEVAVAIPDGFDVESAPAEAILSPRSVTWRSSPRGDVRLTYVFVPRSPDPVDAP